MAATRYRDSLPTDLGFLPVLLANLFPLVGVLWLDWDPETLVVVYALELLVLFPIAGVKALFAENPPESDRDGVFDVSESTLVDKRGHVRLHDRLPPMYPRNVPFATAVVGGGAWISLFVVAPLSEVVSVVAVLRQPEVLVSAATLVSGQLVETVHYVVRRRYEDRSPFAVVEIPARQAVFLASLLFFIVVGGATLVLVVFVFVKVLVEWSGFRSEREGGGRITGWLAGPDGDRTVEPVAVPDGQPAHELDVDRRSAVAAALWETATTVGPFYVTMCTFVWLGTVAFLVDGRPSLTLWVGMALVALLLFGLMLCGDVVEGVLERRWLTYRRVGDHLVAYDRLTHEVQWTTPVNELRDVDGVEDQPADRYFGTRTFTATTGWGDDETEHVLGPVDDPERFAETFDLPIRSTELSPLDRRFVGAAVASVVLVLLGGVVLSVTPIGPSNGWLFALLALPLLALVPRGLMRFARG